MFCAGMPIAYARLGESGRNLIALPVASRATRMIRDEGIKGSEYLKLESSKREPVLRFQVL
jgi:hypothetical protein